MHRNKLSPITSEIINNQHQSLNIAKLEKLINLLRLGWRQKEEQKKTDVRPADEDDKYTDTNAFLMEFWYDFVFPGCVTLGRTGS